MSVMKHENQAYPRRSDLDALRAGAMLLGIVLHASLSFFPSLWMVADSRSEPSFGVVFSAIHGFRMPLFFVMSGFFSAMLLHRRGWLALVGHRYRRVLLPLLLGMVTVVPATHWISGIAVSSPSDRPASAPVAETSNIWNAARDGDLAALQLHLDAGMPADQPDPVHGGTPLMWAAATGQWEAIELLTARGADVNAVDRNGGTGLHAAAFLGYDRAVEVLIRKGASVNAVNDTGKTSLDLAMLDEGITRYYASMLQLEPNPDSLVRSKAAIAGLLRQHGGVAGKGGGLAELLTQMPVFNHLWFLWFLWWLVVGYAAVSAIGGWLSLPRLPEWLVSSPARYFWLVPLTMIPLSFMGAEGSPPVFGPDTSTGILPVPHILAFYAVFFGFGALLFGSDGGFAGQSRRWWLPLSIAVLVVLPLGLALQAMTPGSPGDWMSATTQRWSSVFLQAAYPWLMTFGLMGLFRRYCPAESPKIRFLSDSAYWLYLVHLPLVIAAQYLVRDWPIPAVAKFLLIVVSVTAFLLWTYQSLVRYGWLGRLLNGPRVRPGLESRPAAGV